MTKRNAIIERLNKSPLQLDDVDDELFVLKTLKYKTGLKLNCSCYISRHRKR